MTPTPCQRLALAAALITWCAANTTAQVVRDGSLGDTPAGPLAGPNYQIPPNLGRQVGTNLVHSFSTFNLNTGESATFTGPASTLNVLARVTGGAPSSINGLLQTQGMPSANLVLINRAGVLIGPTAQINIAGSFIVTTADRVRLVDGGVVNADLSDDSKITTAPPSAFGFVSATPAGVTVQGTPEQQATLIGSPGRAVSIVSGPVQILGGQIVAPGGQVNVASVASAGDVQLDSANPQASPQVPAQVQRGDVTGFGAVLVADGLAGGRVEIVGGNVTFDTSGITANSVGDGDGRGIHIDATGGATLSGSVVTTDNAGAGMGGPVSIHAGVFTMVNGAKVVTNTTGAGQPGLIDIQTGVVFIDGGGVSESTQVLSVSQSPAATPIGVDTNDVSITADTLTITNAGEVVTLTLGPATGADLIIDARVVTIDGSAADLPSPSQIISRTIAQTGGGPSGELRLNVDDLVMLGRASIGSGAFGDGAGGAIRIDANTIMIDAMGAADGLVASLTISPFNGGDSGDVVINTQTLDLLRGGSVNSLTFGTGGSGNVTVNADTIRGDRAGETVFTGISSTSAFPFFGGKAGDVSVNTRVLELTNATLDSSSLGDADSGAITVNATDRVTLTNTARIGVEALLGGTGAGGSIAVNTSILEVATGSEITSSTEGTGPGGSIMLTATDHAEFRGGLVRSDTVKVVGGAAGGSIVIDAPVIHLLEGTVVSSTSFGSGDAGAITLNAQTLVIDGSETVGFTGVRSETRGTYTSGVADLSVSFDITHAAANNVGVTLISPDGTEVRLFNGFNSFPQGDANFADTSFDDAAALPIAGSPAPHTGTFQPIEPLAAFVGQSAQGVWTLEVDDSLLFEGGQLDAWSLRIGEQTFTSNDVPQVLPDLATTPSTITIDQPLTVPGAPGDLGGGRGGNVTINATTLRVTNNAQVSVASRGAGVGGDAIIKTTTAIVTEGGQISASTSRPDVGGVGGRVTIDTRSLELNTGGRLTSESLGSGNAGSVDVTASQNVTLRDGGAVTTQAPLSAGGNVVIQSGQITVDQSRVEAQAGGDGGNIELSATGLLSATSSEITARAGNDGGVISITADPTILSQSLIDGRAGGEPVFVRITSDRFLSSDSQILTRALVAPPEVDIAGGLVVLPSRLQDSAAQLRELCSISLEGEVSSLRVRSKGGLAPLPGAWRPFIFDPSSD